MDNPNITRLNLAMERKMETYEIQVWIAVQQRLKMSICQSYHYECNAFGEVKHRIHRDVRGKNSRNSYSKPKRI